MYADGEGAESEGRGGEDHVFDFDSADALGIVHYFGELSIINHFNNIWAITEESHQDKFCYRWNLYLKKSMYFVRL